MINENSLKAVLNAGWFGVAVGAAFGIASLLGGYIFYRRSRQVSQLSYLMGDAPIIGTTPTRYSDGLVVMFDGCSIPRLTSTSFGLWNSGNTTINGREVVEMDALRLELAAGGQMLRATVEGQTRAVNGATVTLLDSNIATINFDYLDPGDGFRIQILHSGTSKSITVQGTIRGLPNGIQKFDAERTSTLMFLAVLFVTGSVGLVTIGVLVFKIASTLAKGPWWHSLLFVMGLLGLITLVVWLVRRPEKPAQPPRIKGVPRAISEDPTLSPIPVIISTPQGRVQLTPEHVERANRNLNE